MKNSGFNNVVNITENEEKDDVKVLYLNSDEINKNNIADLIDLPGGVAFVLAFISIDSDMTKAGELLKESLPETAKFMMVSAIGE